MTYTFDGGASAEGNSPGKATQLYETYCLEALDLTWPNYEWAYQIFHFGVTKWPKYFLIEPIAWRKITVTVQKWSSKMLKNGLEKYGLQKFLLFLSDFR